MGLRSGFGTRLATGGGGSSSILTDELLATLLGKRSALSGVAMFVLMSEPPVGNGAIDLLATTPAGWDVLDVGLLDDCKLPVEVCCETATTAAAAPEEDG